MYSQRVIQKNLSRASSYLRQRYDLPRGWELRPSEPGDIEEMRQHLNGLLDEKGIPTRPLTREEGLWCLTEQTVCKNNFEYFASNYGRIEGWDARICFFLPNIAQRMFLRQMAKAEERGWAQFWQILKARQEGFTTLWQMLLAHRTFLFKNVKAITGSAAEEKSRAMVQKLAFIWDQMDWWLRPTRTQYEAGKLMSFGELNSEVRVQWGNQKTGIGRGSTPSVAHLSELASFENPEDLVDASLVRTQHENPFSLMGFESTAEGIGNWWNKTWDVNVKFAQQGMARMQPVFFPWYVARDLYPTESWIKRRPVPLGWTPADYIEAHARAAKVYVESTPMLREELGGGWELPLEQKWFYYVEYEEAREKRAVNLFLQEMPATPDEAFQNSNPTVFSIETLAEVRTSAQGSRPLGSYELRGREVPLIYSLGPGVGHSLPIVCRDSGGRELERFTLGELPLEAWPDFDPDGRLYIWEWPQRGEEYGLGVDVAEGVDQDSSVIQVVKKANPWHPDEQVAEWASNKVQQPDLWAFVFALAHLYTTEVPGRAVSWPRVVVEVNLAGGDLVQTEMLKRGWSSFHEQVDLTKAGPRAQGHIDPRDLRKMGWLTTTKTRPKLISLGRKMIRDGLFKVRSPWLAKELGTLEYNLDKKRIEAAQGRHDDRFMALGILLTSWYDPEVYGTAPQAWREARAREQELEKLPIYTGGLAIGRGSRLWKPSVEPLRKDSRSIRLI
jgi:hypothetical protein